MNNDECPAISPTFEFYCNNETNNLIKFRSDLNEIYSKCYPLKLTKKTPTKIPITWNRY